MRATRLFSFALIALALGGCMQRQPTTYYMVDSATGRMVPMVRSTMPPAYAATYGRQDYAPASPQAVYSQPLPPSSQAYATAQPMQSPYASAPQQPANRGLFSSSPAVAQQTYAQQTYAQPVYAPPQQAEPASPDQRGLFTSLRRKPAQPVYAAAPRAGGSYAPATRAYASVSPNREPYTLDAGDKLRIVVFGQDGITNSYMVGADGQLNLPLIGIVAARGTTTSELAQRITEKLKQGYVREPHVSVEVEAYRPFFILGEVTTPGQYPYVANMTAETAIAIAGGFSPRADKRAVQLSRNLPGQQIRSEVPLSYPLRPGDTIMVKERWF
jgi:polysaccharide export outer membrane protein